MRWWAVALSLTLAALSLALYAPTARNGFINLDDNKYIYENPQVRRGLTLETALWALRSTEQANWYPLRRLSHLTDVSLFGMWAGGHHLVSAAWHAAAAGLLCAALFLMTGSLWRSFVVAGLFAVHPLQVESVAWAAERSSVLAGFFFSLTLLLWTRFARRPAAGRYAAVLAVFALGLMAKPSLMPLPLLLLLLDYWPLGRLSLSNAPLGGGGVVMRLLEKVPFLLLSAATGAIAMVAHRQAGALRELESLPLQLRLGNATLSYVACLRKLFWPADLAVFYPHPRQDLAEGLAALAGLGLAAVTVIALLQARRRPYLAVGWLWYVGMLVPMIGLVQFGNHAMADRFAYLSIIGVFVALIWFAGETLVRGRVSVALASVFVGAMLAALSITTVLQARRWSDSETLYTHSLAATSGNWLIHTNLGNIFYESNRLDEAITHYRKAIELNPSLPEVLNNLANLLISRGQLDEAIMLSRKAIQLRSDDSAAHNNLGFALMKAKRFGEAIVHLDEAVRLYPGKSLYLMNRNIARSLASRKRGP